MINKVKASLNENSFYNETELNLNVFTIYQGKKNITGWDRDYAGYTLCLWDGGTGFTQVYLQSLEEAIDTGMNHKQNFEKVKRKNMLNTEIGKEYASNKWNLD